MKKIGRNDPCPCGSGKKFKKCCESKMIGKRFMASKIEGTNVLKQTSNLSSLFQKSIELPKKINRVVQSLSSHQVNKKETSSNISEKEKAEKKEEKEILPPNENSSNND